MQSIEWDLDLTRISRHYDTDERLIEVETKLELFSSNLMHEELLLREVGHELSCLQ